jgi:hypothetical protein
VSRSAGKKRSSQDSSGPSQRKKQATALSSSEGVSLGDFYRQSLIDHDLADTTVSNPGEQAITLAAHASQRAGFPTGAALLKNPIIINRDSAQHPLTDSITLEDARALIRERVNTASLSPSTTNQTLLVVDYHHHASSSVPTYRNRGLVELGGELVPTIRSAIQAMRKSLPGTQQPLDVVCSVVKRAPNPPDAR